MEKPHDELELTRQYVEAQKVTFDYVKHVTALDTGSIIVMTVLLEKFFKVPEWSFLIPITFVGFIMSIAALTLTSFGIILSIRTPDKISKSLADFTSLTFIAGIIFFFIGIIAISLLAIKNWA
jgi:hypothetical protein